MKLKLKFRIALAVAASNVAAGWHRFRSSFSVPRSDVLANELGQMDQHGRETLQIDPAATIPGVGGVSSSGRYLGYERGSTQYYAKLWDGGSASTSLPLGISPDAPYQIGDFLTVDRLGAIRGIQLGVSAGAVTIDHLVYAAANGQIGDLESAATTFTAWCIGRATKTVSAAGQEITFVPCNPYLLTTTAGTITNPTNPL